MSPKDLLDNLAVPSPCSANWESLVGNDQVRFCQHCDLSVHNISSLSRRQALQLVARSKGRLCVRYVLLPDGSISTRPKSSSLYRIGRRASRLAAGAFSATLTVSAATALARPLDPTSLSSAHAGLSVAHSGLKNFDTGGSIKGTVLDPHGAVIPGASVSLTLEQVIQTVVTGSDGEYRFEGLAAGDYTLTIEAPGFATKVLTAIVLGSDDEKHVDLTLDLTSTTETVGVVVMATATEPLVRAAYEDDLETVKQILAGKPNVNVRDKLTNTTAIEHALLNANREMVQLLLWAGADVNAADTMGRTPIMLLGEQVTPEMVWDLIHAGAKVNLRDHCGDTPLSEAAASNNVETLRVLLDAGASVNVRNNDGQSPLIRAAAEGLVHNVRALILAGADLNARDIEGKTAWGHALTNEHRDVLRLLRSYGADEPSEPAKASKR